MRITPDRVRALRVALLVLIAAVAVIAIVDGALAAVVAIMAIGLAVLILPPLVIHYDEEEQSVRLRRPGSR